ncbi:hypothetical protein PQX77_018927 [Marasmius sp. AFHP31]|nr:hypothetical protein PQX77_018927 [Marasmius sp. AFHP31]
MSDNASKSPKRRRLRKKWLTVADSNPTIHSPPPNAADYRLPGLGDEARPEEIRTEWMEVENGLTGGTFNTLPAISPSLPSYPDTPQTLVEEPLPRLHTFNSPLQALLPHPVPLMKKTDSRSGTFDIR